MTNPENRLSCRLDSTPESEREQQRLAILTEMGLLEAESVPIFEEATQTAAHSLNAPICILGLIDRDRQWFKSAIGLSRIGLMNSLASSRQLPREEAFCTHVVDSHQILVIHDTLTHSAFANSLLAQQYGIRAYLGVPLLMSTGYCLGTLAVMELAPRHFTTKEIEFLELIARWSVSEFERNHLLKQMQLARPAVGAQLEQPIASAIPKSSVATNPLANSVKVNLIAQMTQELCTPLTSILGMASVLNREIYGPLTDKQKEYMDIVHHSGQYLLSLVNEILELGALDDSNQGLSLTSVDIEMLCQQVINTLKQVAQRRDQQLRLTVEPGHRIWVLDKDKVRQMLYHLIFGIIQSASTESILRIHVSRKLNQLVIKIWTSHPWLGDGLPQTELHFNELISLEGEEPKLVKGDRLPNDGMEEILDSANPKVVGDRASDLKSAFDQSHRTSSRHSLGLMLTRQLAELHGGQIVLQGSAEAGYRYVITLPHMTED
ncbi:GAF domain-containing sensor histidine kinase [Oculatella sp. FACHB-28]|uniref:GAF domain-containing sensor histidine kinase n=1 Tax=Oculatella sp. FACHB-28 TaxID=2692845 RepID=UPI0016857663|nr:GAF domain-containing sensor histidine kinase [Oculatella sp. FACHB-28]MBD2059854.1 GAF domain-containing sensor histidine kinase [Oculatella sp. FACHB-28]